MKNDKDQKTLKKFKKEYPLSKDYEYVLGSDDAGRTIDVHLPSSKHAKRVRKKLPVRYQNLRVIVFHPSEKD